jgi:two-component system CheB/CheR fusion protein
MPNDMRIVGIGASAGGVEALTDFFAHVPAHPRMAYLVVLHLLPGHVSRLPEIIGRVTKMPVVQATDGAVIETEHVYVIPPDSLLSVSDGRLRVRAPSVPGHSNMPIDFLLSSMAAEIGSRAIGVVLSGVGSDGALGLKAIKQADGFAVAQGSNGSRPRHSEMPDAAIAATAVDLVLPVEHMAERIANLPPSVPEPPTADGVDDEAAIPPAARAQIADLMPVICTLLRTQLGHDFSGYKRPTFMRRVHRRMQFLEMEANDYVGRLRSDPQEVSLLFHDLLIGVTSFFRDPETFEVLRRTIIPQLFAGKPGDGVVRVWVPGCATGEEAYSLAMLIREHMTTLSAAPRVQIFATDLDEAAITLARAGRYPSALVKPVPAEYLTRFFTATDGSYAVTKDIRELCTFSAHSLIRDPPFSRIDLISCRNVLIYLDSDLQARVVRTFHYALAPGGVLVLSGSETVTRYAELFQPLDRKHRIFQRMEGVAPLPVAELVPADTAMLPAPARRRPGGSISSDAAHLANARVLESFAPAFVVVNATGEVLHFSARTGKYLEAAPGAPSRDLVAMARRGLRPELRAVLRSAIDSGRTIARERVQVDVDGGTQAIALTVEPLGPSEPEQLFLVVQRYQPAAAARRNRGAADARRDGRSARARPARGARTIAVDHRGARDGARGAEILERGTAFGQRGTAIDQRGAGDLARGNPVDERGAADGQRPADQQGRGARPGQQRPAQSVREHQGRHHFPRPVHGDPQLHAGRYRHLQPDPGRHRPTAHRHHQPARLCDAGRRFPPHHAGAAAPGAARDQARRQHPLSDAHRTLPHRR